jgi:hypothetical protein
MCDQSFSPVTFKVKGIAGEEIITTVNSQQEMAEYEKQIEALKGLGQLQGEPEIVTQ